MTARVAAAMIAAALFPGADGEALARVPPWATAVLPSGASFSLEVVADDASRARGYMGRDRVGPLEGMLFWYPEPGRFAFWMKNCRVPLDIVWLDSALRVVHVVAEARPCSPGEDCPLHEPPREARYVLEFAGGTAGKHGLGVGSTVVILADPPFPWDPR